MKNVKAGHAKPIVCLDAGHYGKYNRSPVVPAYYESEMNWKLHNYLTDELEAVEIEVWPTRLDQTRDLELTARGRTSKGADLFISLHSNACGTESVDRPVGIYLVDDNCSTVDEQSKEIAALLAQVVADVMGTKDKPQTYSRKSGSGNQDYYGVLRGAHQVGTAGVILEHSFHTNTRAAKWLLDDANLKKLAKAEAKVIAQWFGMENTAAEPEDKPQNKPIEPENKTETVKIDPAKEFNKAKAGTYRVVSADGVLNLRSGADASKTLIEAMPSGTYVRCYGYYTGEWLYVVSESSHVGFCHGGYLKKV